MTNIKILDINGVTLKTAGTRVLEDISVEVDNTGLIAENIKEGITILGVEGTLSAASSGGDSEWDYLVIQKQITSTSDIQTQFKNLDISISADEFSAMMTNERVMLKLYYTGLDSNQNATRYLFKHKAMSTSELETVMFVGAESEGKQQFLTISREVSTSAVSTQVTAFDKEAIYNSLDTKQDKITVVENADGTVDITIPE